MHNAKMRPQYGPTSGTAKEDRLPHSPPDASSSVAFTPTANQANAGECKIRLVFPKDNVLPAKVPSEWQTVDKWVVVGCKITDVVRAAGLPKSVPPTKPYDVTATITPSLAGSGHNVQFDVTGGSADNGSATITANGTRTATGPTTVTGGNQTEPGHDGQLQIRARLDGADQCGESAGFSVCAHPTDYTDAFLEDIDKGALGVLVQDGWSSDGGGAIATELTQTEIKELVAENQRDNPPFTVGGAGITTGYWTGAGLTTDTHQYRKADIASGPAGTLTYDQLCIFKCKRCAATDITLPNSGFQIKHHVYQVGTSWKHKTTKNGEAVTIGSRTSAAGSANVTSYVHDLP